MPSISICIPTYNRANCLAELLDSIVAQNVPDIEVVIGDDASPDNTAEVARLYRDKLPRLVFMRHPQNIGLDRNFLAVVEAASSDYVWLLGDDDRVEPNGVQRVLDALNRWPGVSGLTLGVIDYDREMRHAVGVRVTPPTQRIVGVANVFREIADLLGFMSALVVDRRKWLDVVANDAALHAYENYYLQVYILGRVIERHGSWGVIQEPCVGFRTSNDQFLNLMGGWQKRLKMDIVAYDQIANGLFPAEPSVRHAMLQRIFNTHVLARLINAKTSPGPTPEVGQALKLLFDHYRSTPEYWTKAVPVLLAPNWLLRNTRTLYKRFSKSSGSARARELVQSEA